MKESGSAIGVPAGKETRFLMLVAGEEAEDISDGLGSEAEFSNGLEFGLASGES